MKLKLRLPYDFLCYKVLKTIMRAFIFFFCTVVFSFNSEIGFSQDAEIEIDQDKSVSVEEIFNLIKTQTDYKFVYRYDLIKDAPSVFLKKGIIKAGVLLKKGLDPVSCTYEFTNDIVVVKQKTKVAFLQEKKVTGVVSDISGSLPGVVIINKTTSIGVSTDFGGKYSIKAKAGDVLSFSFLGYKTVEKVVSSSSNIINVVLEEDVNSLNEVVITALGIKKSPKEITYAVQTLKTKDITATRAINPVTGMVGKVAGLQINTSTNGVNPITRILLRGSRSIAGNNRALIVVDGIPGSRLDDLEHLNPDDIESITILKGANAAALYGSGAVNGVVQVTTKSGEGKLAASYSHASEILTVAYLPKLQEEFGVGVDGELVPLGNVNFGPRFDGRLVDISETYDDGRVLQAPYSPIKNRNKKFYDTGVTTRHGFTLSGGDADKGSFFMSIGHANVAGVTPKNTYSKTNFRFKANKRYGRLKAGGNVSFTRENKNIAIGGRSEGGSIYSLLLQTPLHVPISKLKNWKTGEFSRNEVSFFRYTENPYFIIDSQRFDETTYEFALASDLAYEFSDALNATFKANYNSRSSGTTSRYGALTYEFQLSDAYRNPAEYGSYVDESQYFNYTFNTDFILNYKKELTDDFKLKANLGHNMFYKKFRTLKVGNTTSVSHTIYSKMGFYTDATLAYKDYLFLYVSGRNDILSVLPKNSRSFFYPSAGLSFVASDAFPQIVSSKRGLSYLKLSTNIARVGGPGGTNGSTVLFKTADGFPYGDLSGTEVHRLVDPFLTPEFTTSIEASLEFGLFNNRLITNITGFKTNTTDQIATIYTPRSSGSLQLLGNVGEVENLGLEIGLNGTVIKKKDFSWDLGINATNYKNEVISLANEVNHVVIGIAPDNYSTIITAIVGDAYPYIVARDYERDDQGRVVVDDDGDPISGEIIRQGQSTPKFIMGLNTTLKYKNLSLMANMTYRTGHIFYNGLARQLESLGLTEHGVSSNREPFVFPNSVYSDGNGGYVENTNRLTSGGGQDFFNDHYRNIGSNYINDATTLRLREVSLSYKFDKKVLNSIGLSELDLKLYGRNLFTFRPSGNVFADPEFSSYEGNAIGVSGSAQGTSTRQMGFSLNVKF
ncbi:SusC/RagA family TonB-linked outer membrane protein [uncultured Polaribacter sp.]|uniref:SusC/RagA family TonB-linked outer membrane protein n=1 Tax=uncultured Polaribacter sp. TaxID=174711 RepID=UPI002604B032|nr:SusC/RagA family TonB-linked outer membrane protein [uncultured Polaribacter sp.]